MAIVKVNGLTIGIVKVSEVNVKELEKAPKWDGHTSSDAIQRIGNIKQSEGKWIIAVDSVDATFICSKCGYSYVEADPQARAEYNYCPNCGMPMDGGAQC